MRSRLLVSLLVSLLFATLSACTAEPLNPAAGDTLTSTSPEPAGGYCAAGGVAVHVGVDANANGVLDLAEIASTTYSCSHRTLLREDPIGSGAECPGGGVRVRDGHDLDDDGVLEDAEIETTTTACYSDELFHGDLKTSDFATPDAQTKLSHVRVVTGSVTIDSVAAMLALATVGGNLDVRVESLVELPALGLIAGDLLGPPLVAIGGDQGVTRAVKLDAPVLARIGGSVSMMSWRDVGVFSAPSLVGVDGGLTLRGTFGAVDLSRLNHVGKGLEIQASRADALALPALERVAFGVRLSGSFAALDLSALETAASFELRSSNLRALALPSLETVRTIEIGGISSLTTIAMPRVAGVTAVSLFRLPLLTTFELPRVTALDSLLVSGMAIPDLAMFGWLRAVGKLQLLANPALVDVQGLSSLTTASTIRIVGNARLASLAGLEGLTRLSGDLVIQNNAALASLAGLAALTNVTGEIAISENAALPAAEVAALLARLGR